MLQEPFTDCLADEGEQGATPDTPLRHVAHEMPLQFAQPLPSEGNDAHVLGDDHGFAGTDRRMQRDVGKARREAVDVDHVVLADEAANDTVRRGVDEGRIDLPARLQKVGGADPYIIGC